MMTHMPRTSLPIVVFLYASVSALACSPDLTDYWGAIDMDAAAPDTDADADSDADADGGADTDECGDTESTCGDGDAGADADASPFDPDAGASFCDSAEYAAFLAQEPVALDDTGAPYRGDTTSPELVVTGFSNFLCVHCRDASLVLEELYAEPEYAGRTVYYFRHFPFSESADDMAVKLHRAAEAAHMQGDFFAAHDAFYDAYPVTDEATMLALLEAAGVDMDQFDIDYADAASLDRVIADRNAGLAAGVTGTPTVYVDGRKVKPWTMIRDVLDCLLAD
jgi:hypothetical protein